MLRDDGFSQPTPIQEQGIPPALEGRDVIGIRPDRNRQNPVLRAPRLTRIAAGELHRNHMLVLTPTRELANQVYGVAEHFGKPMHLNVTSIYGGVGMQPQIDALQTGAHVIVATPGRLLDHMSRGRLNFDDLVLLVSDVPMTPEGIKTTRSDADVSRKWSEIHLEVGIDSLTEVGDKGETIKHFRY